MIFLSKCTEWEKVYNNFLVIWSTAHIIFQDIRTKVEKLLLVNNLKKNYKVGARNLKKFNEMTIC